MILKEKGIISFKISGKINENHFLGVKINENTAIFDATNKFYFIQNYAFLFSHIL